MDNIDRFIEILQLYVYEIMLNVHNRIRSGSFEPGGVVPDNAVPAGDIIKHGNFYHELHNAVKGEVESYKKVGIMINQNDINDLVKEQIKDGAIVLQKDRKR